MIDRVAEHAITTGFAALSSGPAATMPHGYVQAIRRLLEPLRKIMEGMSLLLEKTPQGLDYALSFGERVSAFVLSQLLEARGIPATYVDARRWVSTDCHFGRAKIDWPKTRGNAVSLWHEWKDKVSVHTGFIGRTVDGRTTTLGRNGSDYTATLLASALSAAKVVINTDVPGVMTADPRIVKDAVPVANLTYAEALELAVYGSGLFHPRTFIPLMETGVPMLIRNTMDPAAQGTLISREGGATKPPGGGGAAYASAAADGSVHASAARQPTCITSLEQLAMVELVSLRQQSSANLKLGTRLSHCLADVQSTVYMEAQAAHGQSVVVLIPIGELEALKAALNKALAPLISQKEVAPPNIVQPVTMLSVVLDQMRTTPKIASRISWTLGQLGINILAVTTGKRSFTTVINASDTARAVRGVHAAFNMSRQLCSVVVIGGQQGVHGSSTTAPALVTVLQTEMSRLQRELSLDVRLVGAICSSDNSSLFVPEGVNIAKASAILSASAPSSPEHSDSSNIDGGGAAGAAGAGAGAPTPVVGKEGNLTEFMLALKDLPTPIVVDCSGNEMREDIYTLCLANGISVVVSNAVTISNLSERILPLGHSKAARQQTVGASHGAYLYYDATVGGSLPVLSTIRSLHMSGDRIVGLRCALSGSINSITSEIAAGTTLSAAVAKVIEARFMESDPRIDLLGLDFAKKLVVLARQVGAWLTTDQITITPLVPTAVIGDPNSEVDDAQSREQQSSTLLAQLQQHDAAFSEKYAEDVTEFGRRLRFVGNLEFEYNGLSATVTRATIEPIAIGPDDPIYRIKNKEVFVALTTALHHSKFPLTMYSAGQGGVEGAAGLLSDIIRVGQQLRD